MELSMELLLLVDACRCRMDGSWLGEGGTAVRRWMWATWNPCTVHNHATRYRLIIAMHSPWVGRTTQGTTIEVQLGKFGT
jgi:hypothetical protein